MALLVEDLDDQTKYRQILRVPYNELIDFIMDYLARKSGMMIFFWLSCLAFLILALKIRFGISDLFPLQKIFLHTVLGSVIFPIICIPVHELLHIIPYYVSGGRNIRVGMDLKQYLFYVTAHRYVASPSQFKAVALVPFILITVASGFLVFFLPGVWKWSISLFMFVHATMCAGDFALLNFYFINRDKRILTWDDADNKIAYFYEDLNMNPKSKQ